MGCRGGRFKDCTENSLIMDCFLGNAGVCKTYYGVARERTNGKKGKIKADWRRTSK